MIPICLPSNDNSLVGEVGSFPEFLFFKSVHYFLIPSPFSFSHFVSGWHSYRLGQIVRVWTNISRPPRSSAANHIKQQVHEDV